MLYGRSTREKEDKDAALVLVDPDLYTAVRNSREKGMAAQTGNGIKTKQSKTQKRRKYNERTH